MTMFNYGRGGKKRRPLSRSIVSGCLPRLEPQASESQALARKDRWAKLSLAMLGADLMCLGMLTTRPLGDQMWQRQNLSRDQCA